mmetsp:Transcript_10031/g.14918  ORF Transcript_10031/g.14918 Transcript_10031/m.14918 type:complete len:1046 (+) Transcript_10031:74-3211(+)
MDTQEQPENPIQSEPDHVEDDADEIECRVCRGPAEEGRPLFTPCKCSGSIAFTHHDCLVEWLNFTAKQKKCELCGHTFEFQPLYSPNTPDKLPKSLLMYTLVKHCVGKVPRILTVILSVVTWLAVIPLVTAHVYYSWLNSPKVVLERWPYIGEDVVAGIVISVCIVVSFLSVMSFVDFLRFHWAAQQNNMPADGDFWRDADEFLDQDDFDMMPQRRGARDRDRAAGRDGARAPGARFQAPQPPQMQPDEDIEIHLALNELLGLHSPLILIRNAIWYICFIVLYLGVVVYLPWRLGGLALSVLPFQQSIPTTDHLLTLPDLITLFVGYATQLAMGAIAQCAIIVVHKINSTIRSLQAGTVTNLDQGANENEYYTLVTSILHASLKIITLLFLKMAFLPLLLGFILDMTTLPLFTNISIETRLNDLIQNVVVSVVLHWVMGITFMLIITVSVLQLREVMHPMILKDVIRPQEPNVDLLGNLLSEGNITHAKRIAVSLGIYISLLMVHIYIPIQILSYLNLQPTWEIKCVYWFGNLGRIGELLIFHLCMLGFLERFKNQIGKTQHKFLMKLCGYLDLIGHLLPCHVQNFEYVGCRSMYDGDANEGEESPIDLFWVDLSRAESKEIFLLTHGERMLSVNSSDMQRHPVSNGFYWLGKKVLDSQEYHVLSEIDNVRIPTVIGRFRLRKIDEKMLVYKEVPNISSPIDRPPHNWDDLAGGGAEVQGRWSWGNERPSDIELATASRKIFTSKEVSKLAVLLALSWTATVLVLICVFTVPLKIGRAIFELLNISPHDPLGFVLGEIVMFACLYAVWYVLNTEFMLKRWIMNFKPPTSYKLFSVSLSMALWFAVTPSFLGDIYFSWCPPDESIDFGTVSMRRWCTGFLILHAWAASCYYEVYSVDFWIDIGLVNPQNQRNRGAQDVNGVLSAWQGRQGKVGKFYTQLYNVFSCWEWESVDKTVLLKEFATPIALRFGITRCIPSFVGEIFGGGVLLYRVLSFITICVLLTVSYQEALKTWFARVHKVAKDDLYLIGERLINYRDPKNASETGSG